MGVKRKKKKKILELELNQRVMLVLVVVIKDIYLYIKCAHTYLDVTYKYVK